MDPQEWLYRLRSARQKKRLVRKDRDKQLIRLDRRQSELLKIRWSLPMIPLDRPYQKGWKRLFVLRDDVQRSSNEAFHQALLDKINTVIYHFDKSFKVKKRRKRRYGQKTIPQSLREISDYDWQRNHFKLTEEEQAYFLKTETMHLKTRYTEVRYVYTETWRFVLKVMPHIITEVKMLDEILEQEIKSIDNHIDSNNLWPRIRRLTNGRSYRPWEYVEKPKYHNELKNMPAYGDKEAYLD
ncbi:hypothetical protein GZH53_17620 [Flavihumibacter sp. R14]|nr:hypothetical protein [Flavihumibacter soli]